MFALAFVVGAAQAQSGYSMVHSSDINPNPNGIKTDSDLLSDSELQNDWNEILDSSSTPSYSSLVDLPSTFAFDGQTVAPFRLSSTGLLTFGNVGDGAMPPTNPAEPPSSALPEKEYFAFTPKSQPAVNHVWATSSSQEVQRVPQSIGLAVRMVNFDSTTPAQADITLEVNGQVASTFGFPNATLLNSPYFKRSEHPEMENSLIIELVHIAEGCRVVNSMVGPNVSIGEHAVIEDSIIKDSIIGSYTKLPKALLKHLVIGSDAVLTGPSQSLNLGDNNEVSYGWL
jgi:hypothetical protein